MLSKEQIMKALSEVVDPEMGIPITQMDLIEKIDISQDKVVIDFHLTMPFCPPMFATMIASDMKERVQDLGVKQVIVNLRNHFMADQINKEINKEAA